MADDHKNMRMSVLKFLWDVKNGRISLDFPDLDPVLGVAGTVLYDRLGKGLTPDEFKAQLDYLEEKRRLARKPSTLPDQATEAEEQLYLSFYSITAEGIDDIESSRKQEPLSDVQDQVFDTKKIFLVHGHDEGTCEAVARFLEKLELEPLILHEQPNKGRTIIEKFVDHSDVPFAIVLLTADDRGGQISEAFETQKPRARQNVIFELGFFLGKLGRDKVCALYEEGVEIPSDYRGVLFVKLDRSDSWKVELAREMKSIGLPIDMNRVL